MAYGQSSGTQTYNPFASDLLIDAYERCGIYALESKHLQSGRRSMNLLLTSAWSNRGINLFKMTEIIQPLPQGVSQFFLSRAVASVYDCYRRQYQMNAALSYALAFTTSIGSPNVTIAIPGNSSPVGSYIGIAIPVAVGGLILYGFYQVIATPTANSVTVVAAQNATGNVTAGGAVPAFTTTLGSQTVSVALTAHGYVPGQSFPVGLSTQVGGVTLFGNYVIQAVTDADHFTILANANALSGATVSENAGQASISTQDVAAPYTDILLSSLSRDQYVAIANKTAPGPPTLLWVNKQIIPQFTIWPVTDATGPYEIHCWCLEQIQDVNPSRGQTLDLPPRMFYALVADLARDLSIKWAPARYTTLKAEATQAWAEAEGTDVENASTFIVPQLPNGLN